MSKHEEEQAKATPPRNAMLGRLCVIIYFLFGYIYGLRTLLR